MPNPVPKVRGVKLTSKNMRLKPHSNSRKFLRDRYRKKHTPFIPNPEPLNRVKELKKYRNSRRALKQTNGSGRNALNKSFSNRQNSNGRVRIFTSSNRTHNNSKSSHPLLNNMEIKPIREQSSEFNPIFYKAQNGRPGVKLG
jgi:hypothetical protein